MVDAIRSDIQEVVTNKIIALIENGDFLPWQKPWKKTGEQVLPYNWSTRQMYTGVNTLILLMENERYSSNAWLTFKQAQALGGTVRKGEKGTECVFFKPHITKDKITDEDKSYLVRKSFWVFNVEQVDNLPDAPVNVQPEYNESECVEAINALAKVYCDNTGLRITHGGNQAYYSPALDMVKMPTSFVDGYAYAAVLAHELGHSTGAKHRLNRFDRTQEDFKTHEEAYAAEELCADLVSAFITSSIGVTSRYDQHASYLASWLKALKNDKTFLFKACAAASKAHNYFMDGGVIASSDISDAA